ncbi:MAG: TonB-dependent receptor [Novosphingobium sp.]|uniref:TonB-dependent receptor n=1 Tax=Novosphingobium sp. TaxID=1874826 RepID=UPI0027353AB4|nr:TonB-dependent receptor [Novosphingobium sp.]MDP3549261.1 TonB-dependent receptor [Novosphingobium sp.]
MAIRPVAFTSVSLLAMSVAGAFVPSIAHAQSNDAPQAVAEADLPAEEDVIVVSGVRAAISKALDVRRTSTQIVDSIVAEDVGKLPDNNVIEALQRVTGIQVTDRSGGEAAGITIRGLSDPLTTMNGRNIFTAAGQSFALQDISANLVKSVNVYKTRSADQIETGLAGQIDVQTRRPFDFNGFSIAGLARGIYNQQADSYNPNVALLVSDRWETGIGEIGLLVDASYSRTKYRNMSTTAGAFVPFATENPPAGSGFTPLQRIFSGWTAGLDYGLPTAAGSTLNINGTEVPYYLSRDAVFSSDLYGERERPSVNVALQWAPNSSSVYTAEVYYSGFRGNTFNSLQFSFVDWWGNPGPFEVYDGTNIIKSRTVDDVYGFNSGDFSTNRTDSMVYALNGTWDLGDRGKIVGDVTYQKSTNQSTFLAMRTDRVASQITADFNAGGGVPSFQFDDNALLADPSVWNVAEFYDNADKSQGDAITGMLDGYYTWDEGFLRQIKAGVRLDRRTAQTFTRARSANALGRSLSTFPTEALFTNSGFFDGRANVPTSWVLPSGYWINDNVDAVRADFGLSASDTLSLERVFGIEETNLAAYITADTEVSLFGRPLQFQAGVRYVDVDTDAKFYNRLQGGALTQSSNRTSRWLPSATLRYELTDNLRVRFNYGETLRRPNFGDINPNYNLTGDLTGVGFGSGSAGTANLRPTQSKNYDLAVEWYFDRDSAIFITGFRREIDGLVVPLTVREFIPDNDITAGATDFFAITRPVNASNGVLEGVEVGLTYFPDYLPGPLDGLGFNGSVTILDSKQNIPLSDSTGNITGETTSQFFSVSTLSYNATLAYDKGPLNARLSYVWRKEFLRNNEARLFANPIGVWFRPEQSLDFQLTWNVTKDIGVTFDAVNLTNSKQQNYYKFDNVGNPDQFNLGTTLLARTFALGVRFKFD